MQTNDIMPKHGLIKKKNKQLYNGLRMEHEILLQPGIQR